MDNNNKSDEEELHKPSPVPDNDRFTATVHQIMQDSREWFPDVANDLPFMLLALSGEVGELCNIVKKVERGTLEHTNEVHLDLAFEATDAFIYLLQVAGILGIDLIKTYEYKRQENLKRFGQINNPDSVFKSDSPF